MAQLTITSTPFTGAYFIGKVKVPGKIYEVVYKHRTFMMHKPIRPSGVFYGPGWMFSIMGVPVCVIMNMDENNALAEFERLSEMLGERFSIKLDETLSRNARKIRH